MDPSEPDTAGPADPAGAESASKADEAKYIADLVARGEAVVVDPTKKSEEQPPLPPGTASPRAADWEAKPFRISSASCSRRRLMVASRSCVSCSARIASATPGKFSK